MTQELVDLKTSILEGRYDDALAIATELEEMSKQGILRNIESYLVRLIIHLIKNQIEQRLTNSWVASIADSLRQIQKLNVKGNRTSYYLNPDDWDPLIEDAIEDAIRPVSVEVGNGIYTPKQIDEQLDRSALRAVTRSLLMLTYASSAKALSQALDDDLLQLPGAEDWNG